MTLKSQREKSKASSSQQFHYNFNCVSTHMVLVFCQEKCAVYWLLVHFLNHDSEVQPQHDSELYATWLEKIFQLGRSNSVIGVLSTQNSFKTCLDNIFTFLDITAFEISQLIKWQSKSKNVYSASVILSSIPPKLITTVHSSIKIVQQIFRRFKLLL